MKKVDFSKYRGEWVVVCDSEVVAHNRVLSKVHEELCKCKGTPTLTKIPEEDILIF